MGVYIGNKFVEYVKTRTIMAMPLFAVVWADHRMKDTGWVCANDFSWLSGTTYKSAYEHLVADFSGELKQETIGEQVITYRLAEDGHKVVDATQEETVTNIYDTTGVAWYYILDTENKRFKLPRTKYNFAGLRDSVGSYVAESLPNGTYSTAMYAESGAIENHIADGGGTAGALLSIKLSDFNSVFKDNAPVQQRATQMYLYFFLGNTVYNESVIDIGGITDELNAKVDLDFNNVKSYDNLIAHVSPGITANVLSGVAPDYNRAFAISSPYTPQEDGWVFAYSGSADWHRVSLSVNGTTFLYTGRKSYNTGTCMTAFVAKGQQISFTADGGVCRFVPCKSVSK